MPRSATEKRCLAIVILYLAPFCSVHSTSGQLVVPSTASSPLAPFCADQITASVLQRTDSKPLRMPSVPLTSGPMF